LKERICISCAGLGQIKGDVVFIKDIVLPNSENILKFPQDALDRFPGLGKLPGGVLKEIAKRNPEKEMISTHEYAYLTKKYNELVKRKKMPMVSQIHTQPNNEVIPIEKYSYCWLYAYVWLYGEEGVLYSHPGIYKPYYLKAYQSYLVGEAEDLVSGIVGLLPCLENQLRRTVEDEIIRIRDILFKISITEGSSKNREYWSNLYESFDILGKDIPHQNLVLSIEKFLNSLDKGYLPSLYENSTYIPPFVRLRDWIYRISDLPSDLENFTYEITDKTRIEDILKKIEKEKGIKFDGGVFSSRDFNHKKKKVIWEDVKIGDAVYRIVGVSFHRVTYQKDIVDRLIENCDVIVSEGIIRAGESRYVGDYLREFLIINLWRRLSEIFGRFTSRVSSQHIHKKLLLKKRREVLNLDIYWKSDKSLIHFISDELLGDFRNLVYAEKLLLLPKVYKKPELKVGLIVGESHLKGIKRYLEDLEDRYLRRDAWHKYLKDPKVLEHIDLRGSLMIIKLLVNERGEPGIELLEKIDLSDLARRYQINFLKDGGVYDYTEIIKKQGLIRAGPALAFQFLSANSPTIPANARYLTSYITTAYLTKPMTHFYLNDGGKSKDICPLAEREVGGNLILLSDGHGRYPDLVKLLEKANVIRVKEEKIQLVAEDTTIVYCGDFINGGSQLKSMIYFLMWFEKRLSNAGGELIVLRGTHEHMLLSGPAHIYRLKAFENFLNQFGLSSQHLKTFSFSLRMQKPLKEKDFSQVQKEGLRALRWIAERPIVALLRLEDAKILALHGGVSRGILKRIKGYSGKDFIQKLRSSLEDESICRDIVSIDRRWINDKTSIGELLNLAGVDYLAMGHIDTLGGKDKDEIKLVGPVIDDRRRVFALDVGGRGLLVWRKNVIDYIYLDKKTQSIRISDLELDGGLRKKYRRESLRHGKLEISSGRVFETSYLLEILDEGEFAPLYGGASVQVYEVLNLPLVIKIYENGLVVKRIKECLKLARRIDDLIAPFVFFEDVKINIFRETVFPLVIFQEEVNIIYDITLEKSTMIESFKELNRRMWRRGILDTDVDWRENYGIDINGNLVLVDFDGLSDNLEDLPSTNFYGPELNKFFSKENVLRYWGKKYDGGVNTKEWDQALAEFIARNYSGKVVEVGIGLFYEVALCLKEKGLKVVATDIVEAFADTYEYVFEGEDIEFIIDDITKPDLGIYKGASLIYSIRPPQELWSALAEVSRQVGVDLLIRPLGSEYVDLKNSLEEKLINYKEASFYLYKPSKKDGGQVKLIARQRFSARNYYIIISDDVLLALSQMKGFSAENSLAIVSFAEGKIDKEIVYLKKVILPQWEKIFEAERWQLWKKNYLFSKYPQAEVFSTREKAIYTPCYEERIEKEKVAGLIYALPIRKRPGLGDSFLCWQKTYLWSLPGAQFYFHPQICKHFYISGYRKAILQLLESLYLTSSRLIFPHEVYLLEKIDEKRRALKTIAREDELPLWNELQSLLEYFSDILDSFYFSFGQKLVVEEILELIREYLMMADDSSHIPSLQITNWPDYVDTQVFLREVATREFTSSFQIEEILRKIKFKERIQSDGGRVEPTLLTLYLEKKDREILSKLKDAVEVSYKKAEEMISHPQDLIETILLGWRWIIEFMQKNDWPFYDFSILLCLTKGVGLSFTGYTESDVKFYLFYDVKQEKPRIRFLSEGFKTQGLPITINLFSIALYAYNLARILRKRGEEFSEEEIFCLAFCFTLMHEFAHSVASWGKNYSYRFLPLFLGERDELVGVNESWANLVALLFIKDTFGYRTFLAIEDYLSYISSNLLSKVPSSGVYYKHITSLQKLIRFMPASLFKEFLTVFAQRWLDRGWQNWRSYWKAHQPQNIWRFYKKSIFPLFTEELTVAERLINLEEAREAILSTPECCCDKRRFLRIKKVNPLLEETKRVVVKEELLEELFREAESHPWMIFLGWGRLRENGFYFENYEILRDIYLLEKESFDWRKFYFVLGDLIRDDYWWLVGFSSRAEIALRENFAQYALTSLIAEVNFYGKNTFSLRRVKEKEKTVPVIVRDGDSSQTFLIYSTQPYNTKAHLKNSIFKLRENFKNLGKSLKDGGTDKIEKVFHKAPCILKIERDKVFISFPAVSTNLKSRGMILEEHINSEYLVSGRVNSSSLEEEVRYVARSLFEWAEGLCDLDKVKKALLIGPGPTSAEPEVLRSFCANLEELYILDSSRENILDLVDAFTSTGSFAEIKVYLCWADLLQTPLEDNYFDLICAINTLEYKVFRQNLPYAWDSVERILKNKGLGLCVKRTDYPFLLVRSLPRYFSWCQKERLFNQRGVLVGEMALWQKDGGLLDIYLREQPFLQEWQSMEDAERKLVRAVLEEGKIAEAAKRLRLAPPTVKTKLSKEIYKKYPVAKRLIQERFREKKRKGKPSIFDYLEVLESLEEKGEKVSYRGLARTFGERGFRISYNTVKKDLEELFFDYPQFRELIRKPVSGREIILALFESEWNIKKAAHILGEERRTLNKRVLHSPEFRLELFKFFLSLAVLSEELVYKVQEFLLQEFISTLKKDSSCLSKLDKQALSTLWRLRAFRKAVAKSDIDLGINNNNKRIIKIIVENIEQGKFYTRKEIAQKLGHSTSSSVDLFFIKAKTSSLLAGLLEIRDLLGKDGAKLLKILKRNNFKPSYLGIIKKMPRRKMKKSLDNIFKRLVELAINCQVREIEKVLKLHLERGGYFPEDLEKEFVKYLKNRGKFNQDGGEDSLEKIERRMERWQRLNEFIQREAEKRGIELKRRERRGEEKDGGNSFRDEIVQEFEGEKYFTFFYEQAQRGVERLKNIGLNVGTRLRIKLGALGVGRFDSSEVEIKEIVQPERVIFFEEVIFRQTKEGDLLHKDVICLKDELTQKSRYLFTKKYLDKVSQRGEVVCRLEVSPFGIEITTPSNIVISSFTFHYLHPYIFSALYRPYFRDAVLELGLFAGEYSQDREFLSLIKDYETVIYNAESSQEEVEVWSSLNWELQDYLFQERSPLIPQISFYIDKYIDFLSGKNIFESVEHLLGLCEDNPALLEEMHQNLPHRLKNIKDGGYDRRPVEAGLLSKDFAGYLYSLRKVLNPQNKPLKVFYPASGADISSILLATNARKFIFVDEHPWVGEETKPLDELKKDYFAEKKRYTYNVSETYRSLAFPLEWELEALGVEWAKIEVLKDNLYQVTFEWGYPGLPSERREIIFVTSTELPEDWHPDYREYLQDIDIYFQKAGVTVIRGMVFSDGERIIRTSILKEGLENLKVGGFAINDIGWQEIVSPELKKAFKDLSPVIFVRVRFGYSERGAYLLQKVKELDGGVRRSRFQERLRPMFERFLERLEMNSLFKSIRIGEDDSIHFLDLLIVRKELRIILNSRVVFATVIFWKKENQRIIEEIIFSVFIHKLFKLLGVRKAKEEFSPLCEVLLDTKKKDSLLYNAFLGTIFSLQERELLEKTVEWMDMEDELDYFEAILADFYLHRNISFTVFTHRNELVWVIHRLNILRKLGISLGQISTFYQKTRPISLDVLKILSEAAEEEKVRLSGEQFLVLCPRIYKRIQTLVDRKIIKRLPAYRLQEARKIAREEIKRIEKGFSFDGGRRGFRRGKAEDQKEKRVLQLAMRILKEAFTYKNRKYPSTSVFLFLRESIHANLLQEGVSESEASLIAEYILGSGTYQELVKRQEREILKRGKFGLGEIVTQSLRKNIRDLRKVEFGNILLGLEKIYRFGIRVRGMIKAGFDTFKIRSIFEGKILGTFIFTPKLEKESFVYPVVYLYIKEDERLELSSFTKEILKGKERSFVLPQDLVEDVDFINSLFERQERLEKLLSEKELARARKLIKKLRKKYSEQEIRRACTLRIIREGLKSLSFSTSFSVRFSQRLNTPSLAKILEEPERFINEVIFWCVAKRKKLDKEGLPWREIEKILLEEKVKEFRLTREETHKILSKLEVGKSKTLKETIKAMKAVFGEETPSLVKEMAENFYGEMERLKILKRLPLQKKKELLPTEVIRLNTQLKNYLEERTEDVLREILPHGAQIKELLEEVISFTSERISFSRGTQSASRDKGGRAAISQKEAAEDRKQVEKIFPEKEKSKFDGGRVTNGAEISANKIKREILEKLLEKTMEERGIHPKKSLKCKAIQFLENILKGEKIEINLYKHPLGVFILLDFLGLIKEEEGKLTLSVKSTKLLSNGFTPEGLLEKAIKERGIHPKKSLKRKALQIIKKFLEQGELKLTPADSFLDAIILLDFLGLIEKDEEGKPVLSEKTERFLAGEVEKIKVEEEEKKVLRESIKNIFDKNPFYFLKEMDIRFYSKRNNTVFYICNPFTEKDLRKVIRRLKDLIGSHKIASLDIFIIWLKKEDRLKNFAPIEYKPEVFESTQFDGGRITISPEIFQNFIRYAPPWGEDLKKGDLEELLKSLIEKVEATLKGLGAEGFGDIEVYVKEDEFSEYQEKNAKIELNLLDPTLDFTDIPSFKESLLGLLYHMASFHLLVRPIAKDANYDEKKMEKDFIKMLSEGKFHFLKFPPINFSKYTTYTQKIKEEVIKSILHIMVSCLSFYLYGSQHNRYRKWLIDNFLKGKKNMEIRDYNPVVLAVLKKESELAGYKEKELKRIEKELVKNFPKLKKFFKWLNKDLSKITKLKLRKKIKVDTSYWEIFPHKEAILQELKNILKTETLPDFIDEEVLIKAEEEYKRKKRGSNFDGGEEETNNSKYRIIEMIMEGYSLCQISKEKNLSYREVKAIFWQLIYKLANRSTPVNEVFLNLESLEEDLRKNQPPSLDKVTEEVSKEISWDREKTRRNLRMLWRKARSIYKKEIFFKFLEESVRKHIYFSSRQAMDKLGISYNSVKKYFSLENWHDEERSILEMNRLLDKGADLLLTKVGENIDELFENLVKLARGYNLENVDNILRKQIEKDGYFPQDLEEKFLQFKKKDGGKDEVDFDTGLRVLILIRCLGIRDKELIKEKLSLQEKQLRIVIKKLRKAGLIKENLKPTTRAKKLIPPLQEQIKRELLSLDMITASLINPEDVLFLSLDERYKDFLFEFKSKLLAVDIPENLAVLYSVGVFFTPTLRELLMIKQDIKDDLARVGDSIVEDFMNLKEHCPYLQEDLDFHLALKALVVAGTPMHTLVNIFLEAKYTLDEVFGEKFAEYYAWALSEVNQAIFRKNLSEWFSFFGLAEKLIDDLVERFLKSPRACRSFIYYDDIERNLYFNFIIFKILERLSAISTLEIEAPEEIILALERCFFESVNPRKLKLTGLSSQQIRDILLRSEDLEENRDGGKEAEILEREKFFSLGTRFLRGKNRPGELSFRMSNYNWEIFRSCDGGKSLSFSELKAKLDTLFKIAKSIKLVEGAVLMERDNPKKVPFNRLLFKLPDFVQYYNNMKDVFSEYPILHQAYHSSILNYHRELIKTKEILVRDLREIFFGAPQNLREIVKILHHHRSISLLGIILDYILGIDEKASLPGEGSDYEALSFLVGGEQGSYQKSPYWLICELFHQIDLGEEDIFYDLSSGYGAVVFYAGLATPVKTAVGIEIVKERTEQCMQIQRRFSIDNVRFIAKNVLDVDLEEGNVFPVYRLRRYKIAVFDSGPFDGGVEELINAYLENELLQIASYPLVGMVVFLSIKASITFHERLHFWAAKRFSLEIKETELLHNEFRVKGVFRPAQLAIVLLTPYIIHFTSLLLAIALIPLIASLWSAKVYTLLPIFLISAIDSLFLVGLLPFAKGDGKSLAKVLSLWRKFGGECRIEVDTFPDNSEKSEPDKLDGGEDFDSEKIGVLQIVAEQFAIFTKQAWRSREKLLDWFKNNPQLEYSALGLGKELVEKKLYLIEAVILPRYIFKFEKSFPVLSAFYAVFWAKILKPAEEFSSFSGVQSKFSEFSLGQIKEALNNLSTLPQNRIASLKDYQDVFELLEEIECFCFPQQVGFLPAYFRRVKNIAEKKNLELIYDVHTHPWGIAAIKDNDIEAYLAIDTLVKQGKIRWVELLVHYEKEKKIESYFCAWPPALSRERAKSPCIDFRGWFIENRGKTVTSKEEVREIIDKLNLDGGGKNSKYSMNDLKRIILRAESIFFEAKAEEDDIEEEGDLKRVLDKYLVVFKIVKNVAEILEEEKFKSWIKGLDGRVRERSEGKDWDAILIMLRKNLFALIPHLKREIVKKRRAKLDFVQLSLLSELFEDSRMVDRFLVYYNELSNLSSDFRHLSAPLMAAIILSDKELQGGLRGKNLLEEFGLLSYTRGRFSFKFNKYTNKIITLSQDLGLDVESWGCVRYFEDRLKVAGIEEEIISRVLEKFLKILKTQKIEIEDQRLEFEYRDISYRRLVGLMHILLREEGESLSLAEGEEIFGIGKVSLQKGINFWLDLKKGKDIEIPLEVEKLFKRRPKTFKERSNAIKLLDILIKEVLNKRMFNLAFIDSILERYPKVRKFCRKYIGDNKKLAFILLIYSESIRKGLESKEIKCSSEISYILDEIKKKKSLKKQEEDKDKLDGGVEISSLKKIKSLKKRSNLLDFGDKDGGKNLKDPQLDGNFNLLSDVEGKIKHLLMFASSISFGGFNLFELPRIKSLLKNLDSDAKITIAYSSLSSPEIKEAILRLKDARIDLIRAPANLSWWACDCFYVLENRFLIKLWFEEVYTKYTKEDVKVLDCPYWKERGFKIFSDKELGLYSIFGGELIVGDKFIFIGPESVYYYRKQGITDNTLIKNFKKVAGQREIILINPYDSRIGIPELDLWFTYLGDERIILGDIERAEEFLCVRRLLDKGFRYNNQYYALLKKRLDSFKEFFIQKGFDILRVPLLPTLYKPKHIISMHTYNNVLLEIFKRKKRVYMPVYGDDYGTQELDEKASGVWEDLGFKVRKIEGLERISFKEGSLRCSTKVLERSYKERVGLNLLKSYIGKRTGRGQIYPLKDGGKKEEVNNVNLSKEEVERYLELIGKKISKKEAIYIIERLLKSRWSRDTKKLAKKPREIYPEEISSVFEKIKRENPELAEEIEERWSGLLFLFGEVVNSNNFVLKVKGRMISLTLKPIENIEVGRAILYFNDREREVYIEQFWVYPFRVGLGTIFYGKLQEYIKGLDCPHRRIIVEPRRWEKTGEVMKGVVRFWQKQGFRGDEGLMIKEISPNRINSESFDGGLLSGITTLREVSPEEAWIADDIYEAFKRLNGGGSFKILSIEGRDVGNKLKRYLRGIDEEQYIGLRVIIHKASNKIHYIIIDKIKNLREVKFPYPTRLRLGMFEFEIEIIESKDNIKFNTIFLTKNLRGKYLMRDEFRLLENMLSRYFGGRKIVAFTSNPVILVWLVKTFDANIDEEFVTFDFPAGKFSFTEIVELDDLSLRSLKNTGIEITEKIGTLKDLIDFLEKHPQKEPQERGLQFLVRKLYEEKPRDFNFQPLPLVGVIPYQTRYSKKEIFLVEDSKNKDGGRYRYTVQDFHIKESINCLEKSKIRRAFPVFARKINLSELNLKTKIESIKNGNLINVHGHTNFISDADAERNVIFISQRIVRAPPQIQLPEYLDLENLILSIKINFYHEVKLPIQPELSEAIVQQCTIENPKNQPNTPRAPLKITNFQVDNGIIANLHYHYIITRIQQNKVQEFAKVIPSQNAEILVAVDERWNRRIEYKFTAISTLRDTRKVIQWPSQKVEQKNIEEFDGGELSSIQDIFKGFKYYFLLLLPIQGWISFALSFLSISPSVSTSLSLNLIEVVFIAPVFEELIFRGGVYEYLKEKKGVKFSFIFTPLIFGAAHYPLWGIWCILRIPSGIIFTYTYYKTNSLKASITSHGINNSMSYLDRFGFIIGLLVCLFLWIYQLIKMGNTPLKKVICRTYPKENVWFKLKIKSWMVLIFIEFFTFLYLTSVLFSKSATSALLIPIFFSILLFLFIGWMY
jgi:hypothetical protein